jgi:hypothetical protein
MRKSERRSQNEKSKSRRKKMSVTWKKGMEGEMKGWKRDIE